MLIGAKSDSMVRSQVWCSQSDQWFQSLGKGATQAPRARLWSIDGSACAVPNQEGKSIERNPKHKYQPGKTTHSITSNNTRHAIFAGPPPPPHHNRFTALFPGPLRWAGARRELLDFMVQGNINRRRHIDHPVGCHSIQTNQCPPPPSPPHFFTGRMPFLPPNQQCQSTEGLAHSNYGKDARVLLNGVTCTVAVPLLALRWQ